MKGEKGNRTEFIKKFLMALSEYIPLIVTRVWDNLGANCVSRYLMLFCEMGGGGAYNVYKSNNPMI
jgi:hypothetical protein